MAFVIEDLLFWGLIGSTSFSWAISIPLYILVLVAIVRFSNRKPFNSQFFILFFALGISDLGCYLGHFVKILGCLGILPEFFFGTGNLLPRFYILWLGTLSLTQYIFIILLTLNRFVVICGSLRLQKLWGRKFSFVITFIVTILALGILMPVMYDGAEFRHVPANDSMGRSIVQTAGPVWANTKHQAFFGVWVSGLLYTLLGLSLVCYSIMIIHVWFLKRKSFLHQNLAIELRLSIVGALLFIMCGCILAFLRTMSALATEYPAIWLNVGCLFNAFANVSDLHNQWALVIVSGEVRAALYELVFSGCESTKTSKKRMKEPNRNQIGPIRGSLVS